MSQSRVRMTPPLSLLVSMVLHMMLVSIDPVVLMLMDHSWDSYLRCIFPLSMVSIHGFGFPEPRTILRCIMMLHQLLLFIVQKLWILLVLWLFYRMRWWSLYNGVNTASLILAMW